MHGGIASFKNLCLLSNLVITIGLLLDLSQDHLVVPPVRGVGRRVARVCSLIRL